MKKYLAMYSLSVFLIFVVFCGNDSMVGNGSQMPNSIVGTLYNPDGSPAASARVYIVPSAYDPGNGTSTLPVDSVITDKNGQFETDSLALGYYNILGTSTTGASYTDSLLVAVSDTPVEVVDTLKPSGSVSGIVRLQPGDDSRTVFILVFGTQTWTAPIDSIGHFTIANMAEGSYHVRFVTTLDDYVPLDTTFTINAGTDLNLPDSIVLPLRIPKITGFAVNYDTLKQIVTLSWDKADTSRITGYNVYRQHVDSTDVKLNVQALTDTFYVDSTGVQDETYIYSVVGVDLNSDEGTKVSGDTISISAMFSITDSIIKGSGNAPGEFGYLARVVVDDQNNIYITDTKNKWLQKFDQTGNLIFRDTTFVYPSDIALSTASDSLLVADRDRGEIVILSLDGTYSRSFSTRGKPYSVFSTPSLKYVVSDSGLEIYDSADSLLDLVSHSFQYYTSADIDADSGLQNIFFVYEDNLFKGDTGSSTFTSIYQFSDVYNDQDARIAILNQETAFLLTYNPDGTLKTNVYAIDMTGTILAEWGFPERITDIFINSSSEITAVTNDGRILSLTLNFPL